MKRAFDVAAAAVGLLVTAPLLVPIMLLIWAQDRHSPFYVAPRVGRGDRDFRMVKLRSMVVDAHTAGWDSTSADDHRITRVGHVVRRFKLDEIPQLWNVLRGEMSFVGPRPNVRSETSLYTADERRLLSVKPGITDFSSIVFSDLADVIAGAGDPNLAYRRLVRPGKSALGLFYVDRGSFLIDLRLIALTLLAIVSRRRALAGVHALLASLGAPHPLLDLVAERAARASARPVAASR